MAGERKPKAERRDDPSFTRRVQRTGSSSLSVTLPKSWTDSMNLQIGDALRFRDLGAGRLEISPTSVEPATARRQKLLKIDATDAQPNLLARLLIGGYITGQDQILVTSRSGLTPEQRLEIRRTVAHVLGMTVVEEDDRGVQVQNFIDPGKYQLHRLVNQVVRLLRAQLEACRAALLAGERVEMHQLGPMEDEVDRFYLLMVRQILLSSDDFQIARDIGVESHHFQIGDRLVAKVLEVAGDLVAGVGREMSEGYPGLKKLSKGEVVDLASILTQVDSLLGSTMQAFTRLSVVAANEALNEISRALAPTYALADSLAHRIRDRKATLTVERIISHLIMAMEMLVIVNEVTINRGVEPETVAQTDREVVMETKVSAEPGTRPSNGR